MFPSPRCGACFYRPSLCDACVCSQEVSCLLFEPGPSTSPQWGACFFKVSFLLQGGGVYIAGSSTQVDFQSCNIYSNEARRVSTCLPNVPIAPMGCLLLMRVCCCSQGAGVAIQGGDVTFTDVDIHNNQATGFVSFHGSKPPHRPDVVPCFY